MRTDYGEYRERKSCKVGEPLQKLTDTFNQPDLNQNRGICVNSKLGQRNLVAETYGVS